MCDTLCNGSVPCQTLYTFFKKSPKTYATCPRLLVPPHLYVIASQFSLSSSAPFLYLSPKHTHTHRHTHTHTHIHTHTHTHTYTYTHHIIHTTPWIQASSQCYFLSPWGAEGGLMRQTGQMMLLLLKNIQSVLNLHYARPLSNKRLMTTRDKSRLKLWKWVSVSA